MKIFLIKLAFIVLFLADQAAFALNFNSPAIYNCCIELYDDAQLMRLNGGQFPESAFYDLDPESRFQFAIGTSGSIYLKEMRSGRIFRLSTAQDRFELVGADYPLVGETLLFIAPDYFYTVSQLQNRRRIRSIEPIYFLHLQTAASFWNSLLHPQQVVFQPQAQVIPAAQPVENLQAASSNFFSDDVDIGFLDFGVVEYEGSFLPPLSQPFSTCYSGSMENILSNSFESCGCDNWQLDEGPSANSDVFSRSPKKEKKKTKKARLNLVPCSDEVSKDPFLSFHDDDDDQNDYRHFNAFETISW